jgi:hypothetical protein
MRAEHETAADYLAALQKQLAQAAARYGQDKVAVDFVGLKTKARQR